MAIKKSELYSKLWKSCDELRGGMDASQYKDYILVLLFMRYVTDKYHGKGNTLIVVPEGGSFKDLVELKGNKDIGDETNKVIRKLADENDLVGVITVADFNDEDKLGKGKEMVDTLTKLIAIFEDEALDFSSNQAGDDDILGDAYEFLMRHFATESGKSKGQFYTPAEVSRIMAQVIGIDSSTSQDQTIYDPTCGSGSLLLKAADQAARGITIYGQEKDVATVALAKMNMILHGNEIADIVQGDTLTSPEFKSAAGGLKTFDFAVSNPPFSTKSWSNGIDPTNDEYERFTGYGIPPAKNGDYAFLLHFLKSLKSKGKGAIILPHGVLFRGNVESVIRESIIKRGYIKGIIGMPANLFYGTGIPAAIIIIDKENAEARKGIFMIDASKGFIKDGNKNRLREQDVHKIVDVFNNQVELPRYSKMVSINDIEGHEYNLNIPRYIDNQEEEDIQDIVSHLLGGIPNHDLDGLAKYWNAYPTLRDELFSCGDCEGYSNLNVKQEEIKSIIFNHPEFIVFTNEMSSIVTTWSEKHISMLKSIGTNSIPKEIIHDISEDLLKSFDRQELIDMYDIYQYIMTYWLETMKDDVYMVIENGWEANRDLIPEDLIINKYFSKEKEMIRQYELQKEEFAQLKDEFEEEYNGEDSVLEELKNDKGNISKGSLTKRVKEVKDDDDFTDEFKILTEYISIIDQLADANKKMKDSNKELIDIVNKKYKSLTEHEVKNLVVDDKWMASIIFAVNGEMDRISHRLTSRIVELSERYDENLPQLEDEVAKLTSKVEEHLQRMGFEW